ncbi:hypothetical protein HAX54_043039 [Datura stramonium]|uniref:CWZF3/5/7 THD domain-containing protein n=1 Tax=Datura stramonium TaxID=4076 RepID=A0ABS8SML2_DATST|nr:hypothetical protein [Datura stramonium]
MERKVLLKQKPHQEIDARIATNGRSTQTESRDLRSQVGAHAEDKLGSSVIKSKPASGCQKGSFKDVGMANTSVNARVSTMLKDPGISVCQNVSHNNLGHLEPAHCAVQEPSAPTPSKRETSSQTASIVLREAEDLRDVADRLKNSGFHAEYNQAYFHKTCALEYEKRSETATAVNTLQVYGGCIHEGVGFIVIKRTDLQRMLSHNLEAAGKKKLEGERRTCPWGGDLNVTGKLKSNDDIIPSKPKSSSFVRLLDFTKDVNSAMEASRKAQNAFAAATNLEKAENKDAFISVKRVIDFSFQDVEEQTCLVKQAIEAINHEGFGGGRVLTLYLMWFSIHRALGYGKEVRTCTAIR